MNVHYFPKSVSINMVGKTSGTLKLIRILLKIGNLISINIKNKKKILKLNLIRATILNFIHISASLYVIFYLKGFQEEDTEIFSPKDDVIQKVEFFVTFISDRLCYFYLINKLEKIKFIMKELKNIEVLFFKIKFEPKYNIRYLKIVLSFWVVLMAFDYIYDSYVGGYFGNIYIMTTACYFSQFFIALYLLHFVFLASVMSTNFISMRKMMKKLILFESFLGLERVFWLYNEQMKLVKKLNGVFSFVFLTATICAFLNVLGSSYFAMGNFLMGREHDALNHVIWVAANFFPLFFVVREAERMRYEAGKFENSVWFAIIDKDVKRHKIYDLVENYFSKKQIVLFDACGLFKIDYPLLLSIISASTTYLMIVWQMNV